MRAIEGLAPDQTPRYVRFSFKGDLGLSPGRAVACRAILSPPPRLVPGDYELHRDAWFQQLGGVGFAVGKCEPLAMRPPASPVDTAFVWLGAVRRALAEFVYNAAGPEGGGMSAAMVSGDRSFITPDDAEALRLSGLAHLLSISGVHMVLVGGIIFFIARFLWPFVEPLALRIPAVHAAALAAIIACTLYFAISGMEVATQRSYIIALIGFGAKLFDRPAISLRSLAIATMPFALHHFDRAALFSVMITLLTTPAAAAAALFVTIGLSEPFLWLMGLTLDVVLVIAHNSADYSPDVHLPRLGGMGMALAAIAIALFCVLDRRGRIFAPHSLLVMWQTTARFLKQSVGWVELKDWRAKNGLNPLIIGDVIAKAPCSGKGAACALPFEAGQAEIIPTAASVAGVACPINATLKLVSVGQSALSINPCDNVGKVGGTIESLCGELAFAPAALPQKRPWTLQLYSPVPKLSKPPKADQAKPQ